MVRDLRKRIGIIVGKAYKQMNSRQLSGILSQAYSLGFSAYTFALNEEFFDDKVTSGEKNMLSLINFSLVDGVIYLPYSFSSVELKDHAASVLAERCDKPVVCIGMKEVSPESVWFDDGLQVEEIIDHLISVHGCRKILCLTGPENMEVAQNRADGYCRAMKRWGVPFTDEDIIYGDFWVNSANQLGEELVSGKRPMPDAVACMNDSMAIALCNCLEKNGMTIPDDLIITGYDGSSEAGFHVPSITTYNASWERLGAEAMRRLYEIITGERPELCSVPCGEITLGGSCGCGERQKKTSALFDYEKMEAGYMDSSISTRLLSAKSFSSFIHELYCMTYVFNEPEYNGKAEYCLCLCEDWDKFSMDRYSRTFRTWGYSERMIMTNIDQAQVYFDTSGMIPPWLENGDPFVIFFTPSHFRDRCFGYSTLKLTGIASGFNIYYQRFCLEVNNALSYLSLHNAFRSIAYTSYIARSRDELTGFYLFESSPQMWEETAELAQLYGEDIYMVGFSIGGMRQIEETGGSVLKNRMLVEFADILKKFSLNREKLFRTGDAEFAVIGSQQSPCTHQDELVKKVAEEFRQQNMLKGNTHFMFIRSGVRVIPVTKIGSFKEADEQIRNIFDENSSAVQPSHMEQMHYSELVALRRDIYAHPETKWNLDMCCARLNISRSHFQKLYRSTFDVNCMRDIRRSKLSYARKLLVTTNDTLQDIAEKCGYDYSHFMRAFNSEVGMTPTQYRRGKDKMQ